MSGAENEIFKRRTVDLESLSKEEYSDLFRTKDIYLAAFLITRGCPWFGLEEYEVIKTYINKGNKQSFRKSNNFIYFLFKEKSKIERMSLNYFTTNLSSLNVNANSFVQSMLNVRSIITNPPF